MYLKQKSYLLVTIQFTCLGYLLFTAPVLSKGIFLIAIELLGISIGLLAVYTMRLSKLRVQPDVHPAASLIHTGIYRWVRHPMYLAILVTTLALLISYFTLDRLAIYLLLLVNLIFKIRHEEQLLQKHFPNYLKVNSKTKRLIPFVW